MTGFLFASAMAVMYLLAGMNILCRDRTLLIFSLTALVLMLSSFYGLREVVQYTPEGRLTDTYNYLLYFRDLGQASNLFQGALAWKGDYLFFSIPLLVHAIGGGDHLYLVTNSLIAFTLLAYGAAGIARSLQIDSRYYPAIILLLAATSTLVANYGNLLRQGMAISFMLVAIAWFLEGRLRLGWFAVLASLLVHKSAVLVVLVMFAVFSLRRARPGTWLLVLLVALAIARINLAVVLETLDIPFISQKFLLYRESDKAVLEFKLYPLFGLAAGGYLLSRQQRDASFEALLSVFMLFLIAAALTVNYETISKRILYYPSVLAPFILVYAARAFRPPGLYVGFLLLATLPYMFVVFNFSRTFDIIRF